MLRVDLTGLVKVEVGGALYALGSTRGWMYAMSSLVGIRQQGCGFWLAVLAVDGSDSVYHPFGWQAKPTAACRSSAHQDTQAQTLGTML